jgi:type IV pilus assembly protein PilA
MPTKLKGMTSLEIAIIVAIILIIAVAVGWYLYTTFIASTSGQPRLSVISAELYTDGTLRLVVFNPGPIDVQIHSIEIAGQVVEQNNINPKEIRVGDQKVVQAETGLTEATPGTMLPGKVILSGGQSFPFNALVKLPTGG